MIKYLLNELEIDTVEYDWTLDFLTDYGYAVNEKLYNETKSIEVEERWEQLAYKLVITGYGLEWLEKNIVVIKHPTEKRYKVLDKGY